MSVTENIFNAAPMSRDRDQFLRELVRELAGVLEDAVGLEEAEGFVARVGARIGEMMDSEYREAAGEEHLNARQVADALVDLKRRIEGGFTVESIDDSRITLINTACPFGDYVVGRESLCMMTSNVFGRIAANNLDYARVELQQTIARGAEGCRVVVHLTEGSAGREYFS
ncbi:MAG: methanogen output domain 1-containing protein [Gammaproteobacteria bacterium]